jgi:DNA-binding NarL/FixJ family response regulator
LPKAILIADDSAGVRRALRHLLEENGEWEVCAEAVNGLDAIEKEAELHPDLVVLDFSMPVMNGLETAKALKRTRPSLPVILFTIFKDRFLEQEAFAAGVSAVIAKENGVEALADYARVLFRYGSPDSEPSSRESGSGSV